MTFSRKIIIKELSDNIFKFKIFILCIAIGVFSITLVNTISSSILISMNTNASSLMGGDLQITTRGKYFNKGLLVWLKKNNISFSEITELRTMGYNGKNPEKSIIIDLKSIDNKYPLYGELKIDKKNLIENHNNRVMNSGEIFVEEALLKTLEADLNTKIFIGNNEYLITGIINNEPDRLTNLVSIGPRVLISKKDLYSSKLNTYGSLVTHKINIRLENFKTSSALINEIKSLFSGESLNFQSIENGSQSSSQEFINRLKVILLLSSIVGLMLGGLGVANSISNYLDKKNKNIAILKSLGASSVNIFFIYLAQTMIISLIGIFIGYVFGIFLAYLLLNFVPLGLNIETYELIQLEVFFISLSYGVITSLIFSIWPLSIAKETKPSLLFRYNSVSNESSINLLYFIVIMLLVFLQVLITMYIFKFSMNSIWFILGCFGLFVFFYVYAELSLYFLKKLTILKKLLNNFALTNLLGPNSPSKNIIICFGMGLSLLISISLVQFNLNKELNLSIRSTAPSFFMIDIQKNQFDDIKQSIKTAKGFISVNEAPSVRGRLIKIKNIPIEDYVLSDESQWLKRYDFGATFSGLPPKNSKVTSGDWWPKDYLGFPLISLDKDIAKDLDVKVGDKLTFNILGRNIEAKISNLREINWQSFGINFFVIFSPGVLENSPFSYLATTKIENYAEDDFYKKIIFNYPNVTTIKLKEAINTITSTINKVSNAARGISAITIFVGIFVLIGAISASYQKRTYDSIIFKVIGASPAYILKIFLLEFLYLGFFASFIACFSGVIMAWLISSFVIGISFELNLVSIILPPIAGTLLVFVIGFLGTKKILNKSTNSTLRIFSS